MVDASQFCDAASLESAALNCEIADREKELLENKTRLDEIRAEAERLELRRDQVSGRLSILRAEAEKRAKEEQLAAARQKEEEEKAKEKQLAASRQKEEAKLASRQKGEATKSKAQSASKPLARVPLQRVSARGASCTKTILSALEDIELKPSVIHVVGASESELSMDLSALSRGLAPGAEVVFIGPHIFKETRNLSLNENIIGPESHSGLQVFAFPQTYQRYLAQFASANKPQFVVLFHPGLDIHYFAWYACLRYWAECNIPVLVTAYHVPGGHGERPETVKTLLQTLVGTGGGAGMWVLEDENPHSIENNSFNAAYYVFRGSHGQLSLHAESLYFQLFEALRKVSHPFAPRVGYLDVDSDEKVEAENLKLLASIAEGAMRGAMYGPDGADEKTSSQFAAKVIEEVLGTRAAQKWRKSGFKRTLCVNCREGYDSEATHQVVCPAVGTIPFARDDVVKLVNVGNDKLDGKQGTLQEFSREKFRWTVLLDDMQKGMLFKVENLQKV